MTNEREFSGYWWLPSDDPKSDSVGGVLKHQPKDNIKLHLFDTISGSRHGVDCIYGVSTEDELITLHDCTRSYQRFGETSYDRQEQRYRVSEAYVGGHLKRHEKVIEKIQTEYSLLHDWVDLTGINIATPISNDKNGPLYELSYSPPKPIDTEINSLSVSFNTRASFTVSPREGGSINETGIIEFQSNYPMSLDKILRLLNKFKYFISLGTGEAIRCTGLELMASLDAVSEGSRHMEMLLTSSNSPTVRESKPPEHMLFTLHDIEQDLADVLSRWWVIAESYQQAIDLLMIARHRTVSVDAQYVGLVAALEAFYTEEIESKQESKLPQPILKKMENALEETNERTKHHVHNLVENHLTVPLQAQLDHITSSYEYFERLDYKFDKYINNISRFPIATKGGAYSLVPRETCDLLTSIIEVAIIEELNVPLGKRQKSYFENNLPGYDTR